MSPFLATAHWSPEHDQAKGSYYVLKEQGRLAGPWTDKDMEVNKEVIAYHTVANWTLLQQQILMSLNHLTDRQMLFVMDPKGGSGKTTLKNILGVRGRAMVIPAAMNSAEDMIQFVMGIHPQVKPFKDNRKLMILDMPRATTEERWAKYCSALEDIHNGNLYDRRYAAKQDWIIPPLILVLCNTWPHARLLSHDRFKLMKVMHQGHHQGPYLKPYTFQMVMRDLKEEEELKALLAQQDSASQEPPIIEPEPEWPSEQNELPLYDMDGMLVSPPPEPVGFASQYLSWSPSLQTQEGQAQEGSQNQPIVISAEGTANSPLTVDLTITDEDMVAAARAAEEADSMIARPSNYQAPVSPPSSAPLFPDMQVSEDEDDDEEDDEDREIGTIENPLLRVVRRIDKAQRRNNRNKQFKPPRFIRRDADKS